MIGLLLANPLLTGATVVALGLGAAAGVQTVRLSAAQAAEAKAKTELAEGRVEWERNTVSSLRRAAEDTQRWQDAATTAEGKLDGARSEINALDVSIGILRTNSDGLRNKLAAYARGARNDSLGACQARAGALADLLAEGEGLVRPLAELARESARAADLRTVEVEALVGAWPKNR